MIANQLNHLKSIGVHDGLHVYQCELENSNGIKVSIINYGATIQSVICPDKNDVYRNVVLGFETLKAYKNHNAYLGCTVGRYANRIAGGTFAINDNVYHVTKNEGDNCLHGGEKTLDKKVWDIIDLDRQSVTMKTESVDGEEGFPGHVEITVRFSLDDQNNLEINYQAESDKDTVLNLTNHSYFNLSAHPNILDHQLQINASYFTPIDPQGIPTGEIKPVANSCMDFLNATRVGDALHPNNVELLKITKGYDHNFVVNDYDKTLTKAATLSDPHSGRIMHVFTTKPGVQLYTGNHLDLEISGQHIGPYSALCLETQHFPNAPNTPAFPSAVLKKGEAYSETTVYQFVVE